MPGFARRLAEWEADIRPASPEARQALRQAVATTFRLERCQAAYGAAVAEHSARARDAWDDDRLAEASTLLGALARRPEVVAGRLRASASGAELMLRLWKRLGEALFAQAGEWSAEEVATACDLLGIPAHLRGGRLPFDPIDPAATADDRLASRREFFVRQCQALGAASQGRLARLDRFERDQAESGASALQAKSVKLVLRYEAAARRWYKESLAAAKSGTEASREIGRDGPIPLMESTDRPKDDGPVPAAKAEAEPEAPSVAGVVDPHHRELADAEPTGWLDEGDFDPVDELDAEPELAFAGASAPAGRPLNRHQRRRREALARRRG